MPKRINIIGSGWLAQPLAKDLQQAGHQVLVTTTQAEKINALHDQGLNAIAYQLGETAEEQLYACDVLIIAITCKDITAFQELMSQISTQQTKHIIYISSTSVYANNSTPHDEKSTELNNEHPLLATEKIIQQHPKSTVIRFAGLVGPKRHPGRFFAGGKTIKNPQAKVNLIHLDDCIGIIKTIIQQNAWGEVFNGCADNHQEKGEFYAAMVAQLGLPQPNIQKNTGQTSDKIILNHKVKTQLGYQFKYPDVMNIVF